MLCVPTPSTENLQEVTRHWPRVDTPEARGCLSKLRRCSTHPDSLGEKYFRLPNTALAITRLCGDKIREDRPREGPRGPKPSGWYWLGRVILPHPEPGIKGGRFCAPRAQTQEGNGKVEWCQTEGKAEGRKAEASKGEGEGSMVCALDVRQMCEAPSPRLCLASAD